MIEIIGVIWRRGTASSLTDYAQYIFRGFMAIAYIHRIKTPSFAFPSVRTLSLSPRTTQSSHAMQVQSDITATRNAWVFLRESIITTILTSNPKPFAETFALGAWNHPLPNPTCSQREIRHPRRRVPKRIPREIKNIRIQDIRQ